MKKFLIKILPLLSILLIVGVALVPEVSNAWIEESIQAVVNGFFARISNIILTLASYLVLISGIFLNQSINLTTHIGDIFNSIPALQEIWVIVRNLSSIFIIFMLLYSSITTILGVDGPSMKTLIKNIVMAGLLINFSLFFVKIGIDASNLVSLQFYRAIAPGASESVRIGESFTAPGLSNVFMSSLKIPKIYQNNGITKGIDVTASIGLATVMGTGVMLTAALSFFGAAIMFSIRTAILIFVMALSPVFFAGMIFPTIKKEVSDKLFGILKNQLIFMPAYLFLMYVALKFISSDGFEQIFNAGNGTPGSGGPLGITFIGVLIQYVIALLFINAPLVFAIQLGGIGAKWVPGSKGVGDVAKWFGAKSVGVAGGIAGGLGQNTYGRVASRIAQSEGMQKFAGSSWVGQQLRTATVGVASGFDKKLGEKIKNREAVYDSLTDKNAKSAYAERLTNSVLTKSGKYSMATTGRADRVAAAKLLTKRESEIKDEIKKLQSRSDELDRIVAGRGPGGLGARPLTAVEQAEYDAIDANHATTPGNTGDLAKENANLNSIRNQIEQFQVNTGGARATPPPVGGRAVVTGGATPKQVSKRGY